MQITKRAIGPIYTLDEYDVKNLRQHYTLLGFALGVIFTLVSVAAGYAMLFLMT
jgi:hypothetical protein